MRQINTSEDRLIIRPRKRLGHNEQVTLSKKRSLLGQQSGGLKSDHLSSTGKQATVLERINFRKRWVNRELRNIWEESYYHRIECSTSNPITALMWKWYLDSNFQPYSHPQRLQEDADGTSIREISNLIYTWRAKMKKGKEI